MSEMDDAIVLMKEGRSRLNLPNRGFGPVDAQILAEYLEENTTLESLHLGVQCQWSKPDDVFVDKESGKRSPVQVRSPKQRFDMNQIGPGGAVALAAALLTNRALTSLHIDNNRVGNDGAEALAEALKHNTTLTELNLYNNEIGKGAGGQAVAALVDALETNTSMTSLSLGGNNAFPFTASRQIYVSLRRNVQHRANHAIFLRRFPMCVHAYVATVLLGASKVKPSSSSSSSSSSLSLSLPPLSPCSVAEVARPHIHRKRCILRKLDTDTLRVLADFCGVPYREAVEEYERGGGVGVPRWDPRRWRGGCSA